MKKEMKTYRLFRHWWDSEYHRNPLFCRNEHHITMMEFTPYYAEDSSKRVKVEVFDFNENARWEKINGEDEWVSSWDKELWRTKDLSRDEANAAWVKNKKVKYVTQKVPKELVGRI